MSVQSLMTKYAHGFARGVDPHTSEARKVLLQTELNALEIAENTMPQPFARCLSKRIDALHAAIEQAKGPHTDDAH